jgi:hypothetical protein
MDIDGNILTTFLISIKLNLKKLKKQQKQIIYDYGQKMHVIEKEWLLKKLILLQLQNLLMYV